MTPIHNLIREIQQRVTDLRDRVRRLEASVG